MARACAPADRQRSGTYGMGTPEMAREMVSSWISLVPSKIVQ